MSEENEVKEILRRMPDDLRIEGIRLRDRLTETYWDLGDWVNRCTAWAFAEKITENKKVVSASCAAMIDQDNCGADTLYNFSLVSAHYTSKKDRRDVEVFPFSHVNYYRKFGEDWRKALEYDLDQMDERNGIPQSKTALQNHFEPHREQIRQYEQTTTLATLTITVEEKEQVKDEIISHLRALEGLLGKAPLVDAEGAVYISRAVTFIHRAMDKIIGRK